MEEIEGVLFVKFRFIKILVIYRELIILGFKWWGINMISIF